MQISNPYDVTGEYDLAEMLEHFDTPYTMDLIEDKLSNIDYASVRPEPNIVAAYESTFKGMMINFPGDANNIQAIRRNAYLDIISVLCKRFNLRFNEDDDNIDPFTAAFYLYDFLIVNRGNYIVNFFTSFIINNKDSFMGFLNIDDYHKAKTAAADYSRRMYADPVYGVISSNISKVINHIMELDISLFNIFSSIYTNQETLQFLGNAIGDCGNFFKDVYCEVINTPEVAPIIITNIRLKLQSLVGSISTRNISEFFTTEG